MCYVDCLSRKNACIKTSTANVVVHCLVCATSLAHSQSLVSGKRACTSPTPFCTVHFSCSPRLTIVTYLLRNVVFLEWRSISICSVYFWRLSTGCD